MSKTRKLGLAFLLCILFTIIMTGFPEGIARASSTSTLPDYHFEIGSTTVSDNSEYELKSSSTTVYVSTNNTWTSTPTVKWTSSESKVVSLESSTTTSVVMNRQGPGYSTITAEITMVDPTLGELTYTINFLVKVSLEVNDTKTNAITYTSINAKHGILVMDTDSYTTQQIYLKYTDESLAVSGSSINVSFASFKSSNTSVVTVSDTGLITVVGAGSADITITSNTTSTTNTQMTTTLTVVVTPKFSFTYSDSSGTSYTCKSGTDVNDTSLIYQGVPSEFTVYSNEKTADNLTWVIYNIVNGKKTKVTSTSDLMEYSISNSGTVTFTNVKAGTYEIYACASPYTEDFSNVPFAYMKIYVLPTATDTSIVMNVGDTYSILDHTNVTGITVFENTFGSDYNADIAKVDTTNFVVTAKSEGSMTITLTYDPDQKLFLGIMDVPSIKIYVTVIDGIALSQSSATIYTGGTLQLEALVTDSTKTITWTSSKTSVVTVETDGKYCKITGKAKGTTTITASQTINGVVKTATCVVEVKQSATSVVVDPDSGTIGIGDYLTLHATVSPSTAEDVELYWKSSNDKIVKITESGALTATVQGVAGGYAVISAINQYNVVVGYCAVTVLQPVTSVVLSETSTTVSLSLKQLQLRATVYPENAENKTVVWSTTDSSKATVTQNGLVTLKKSGTVTIIATSEDNPAAVAYCNINIQIPVASVALDETTKTMYVGQTARLSYVVLPTTASVSTVTWTSSNSSVASVDSTGLVTAKSSGTTVIILKTVDGGYSVFCTITVKQVATAVKLDVSTLSLKTGEYYYLKATLTPKGSTDSSLVWESSDTKVATVDASGKVTAKNAGTAIIMVKTEAGGIAYCKLTVTQAVKGLILNFSEKTIYKGEKFDLIVSVSPSSASSLSVTWKSSNTKIATVTNKGEVAGLIGGVAIITCTTADGGYSATCVVTVKEPVTSIKLDYDTYNLSIKGTVKLTATVSTETATNQKVTWKSSNTKVATVNQNGKVTGLAVGYATITATAQDGSDVDASCVVRVVNPVTSLTLNKSTLLMYVGSSKKLTATIKPTNATYKKAKWSSSDESVAAVDEDGVVIALKAGTAMITAEAMDSSGKKSICYVTVRDRVASTSVTLQDKSVTMVPGETKVVNVVMAPADTTDTLTWSTDNAAVATVNKTTGKITARSTGTAYITVMTSSGKAATVEITVIGLNVTKLVTEEYTTYSQALSVEGATETVTWRIDNPLIAVVYSDGTVSTRAVGTATITATVNGRRLKCTIVVKNMS